MEAKRVIEAILFVSGQPVTPKRLKDLLPEVDAQAAREIIHELNEEYLAGRRAFHVQEVGGGFQLVTHQDLAPWVQRTLERPKPDAVSTAALETLAIIAYRQPITKAEIEAIRGVDITASLETVVERQFVRAVGRRDSPGRPFLYATTAEFLRHFGLTSLEALPPMATPTLPEHPEPASASPTTAG